jgi:UDPglucose 6-dehydrogenase
MVPGPDGKHGFGGMCLPKDMNAFTRSARNKGSPLKILEKVIKVNSELREFFWSEIDIADDEDLPG